MIPEPTSRCGRAERIYRFLLRGYPATFRSEYGAQMLQLFRDQWREQELEVGWERTVWFWFHIVADASRSIARERFNELERRMQMPANLGSLLHWFPTTRWAFTAVFVAGTSLSLLLLATMPTTYFSTARVVIEPPNGEGGSETALRAEVEQVTSDPTLAGVVESLQLTSRWAARYGVRGQLSQAEAIRVLRRHTLAEPQRVRNKHDGARVVSVRFFGSDRQEAAEIANAIAITYVKARRVIAPSYVVQIADVAEPGLRPIRPNWPLGIVVGVLISGAAAVLFALLLKLARAKLQAA